MNYYSRHVNNDTLIYIKVRPWTRMDLTINKELLHKFMNSILSKIIIKPGIYLKTLKKEYYPILQPMFIRELVEVQIHNYLFISLFFLNCSILI